MELSCEETLRPYRERPKEDRSNEGERSLYRSNFCLVVPTSFHSLLGLPYVFILLGMSLQKYLLKDRKSKHFNKNKRQVL